MGKSTTTDLQTEVAELRKRIRQLERVLKDCAGGEQRKPGASADINGELIAVVRDITEHKSVDRSLERTQFAVDRTADSVFWIDESAAFRYVNDSACRSLGYERQELITLKVSDVDPLYPADGWAEHWAECRANGSLTFETIHRRKDGQELSVEVSANYIDFDDSAYIVAIARDITDRKKAESSLRLTQFSVDRAADAVFWVDRDARYRYVNDAACQLLGYRRDELLGLFEFDISPDLTRMLWEERWKQGEREGAFTLETFHLTKSGVSFPVEVSVNHLEFGNYNFIFEFVRDISERKRAEQALRASEQRFQTLADTSPVGIFQTDLDGTSIYANKKYQEILGLEFSEAIGDGWMRCLHPDDRGFVLTRWEKASKQQQPCRLEHRFVSPDGRTTWVHCQAIPVKNECGELTGYVGTVTDITDRKEALQSLAELAHMSRINTMGELVTGLAHELNQPLTAIANFADAGEHSIVQNDDGSLQHAREMFRNIGDQAFRSGEIVRRLRGLVQKTDPRRAPVDLNDLVLEVVDLNQYRDASHDIEISVDFDESLKLVNADAIQIQQVLLNLITNAYDSISAAKTGPRRISISTRGEPRDSVTISVADSGIGLPKENSQQVFDAFYSTKETGMGMGLAISRSIVESHGGRLTAAANSDRGATFEFLLPIHLVDEHATT